MDYGIVSPRHGKQYQTCGQQTFGQQTYDLLAAASTVCQIQLSSAQLFPAD